MAKLPIFRQTIERHCAGGCGAVILYEVVAEGDRYMPVVYVKSGGNTAYCGGHLCHACDMKIGDALRG